MANASVQIAVRGIDKTGAAFDSIRNRARVTGAQIRATMGGALAAAGAYLSVRAIKEGVEELGKLDDIAARTKTNVSELTGAVTGFKILGVNTSVESFAKTLDFMRRSTGREGMAGFYQTVEEISKIPDSAARAKRAVEVFGRSGSELMPLVDNANRGVEAIRGVVGAMPSIPATAAKAGDKADDAMTIVGDGFHSIWLQAIGAVCDLFDGQFVGGVREAAAKAMAWVQYFADAAKPILESTWRRITGYSSAVGSAVGAWWGASSTQLGTQGEVWDQVKQAWNDAIREMEDDLEEIETGFEGPAEKFAAKMREAERLAWNYKNATDSLNDPRPGTSAAPKQTAEDFGAGAAKAATRLTNQLMLSGSSAASRLSILGPEYQNEQREQTKYLKRLVELEEQRDEAPTVELAESDL